VLDNDARAQGVRLTVEGGVVHAANFWTREPTRSGIIAASDIVSVVVRVAGGRIEVALADPTQSHDRPIEVVLSLGGGAVVSTDPGLTVTCDPKTIRLTFDPRGRRGRAARATVTRL
jgi:hypothetical protein